MKKVLLGLFIVFDLALIGASVFVLQLHLRKPSAHSRPITSVPVPVSVSTSTGTTLGTPALSTSPFKLAGTGLDIPAAPGDSSTRKILFTYRNPRSRQVSIRADFTGWKAEPMTKDPKGMWTYLAHLTPGEYAYCFTADDKTFKDPANKRTKQIGRTMVSAIQVDALNAKPAK